jgi:hypothetical protein
VTQFLYLWCFQYGLGRPTPDAMLVDLLAGTQYEARAEIPAVIARTMRAPTIPGTFDSGLAGLTVYRELVKVRPDARLLFMPRTMPAFPMAG